MVYIRLWASKVYLPRLFSGHILWLSKYYWRVIMTNSPSNQQLLDVWQQHTYSEFVLRDANAALGTMTENPYVLMVPLAIGGQGRDGVHSFYHNYFLAQLPGDFTPTPISQIIAENVIVEEAVYSLTHNLMMDWMIPGVPPTGKRVELAVVGIIKFENGKIASEHLYWDHSSVLAQLGVIDPTQVPVKGAESARTLLAWSGVQTSAGAGS
jgi:carboxymethylenebutenolidase